MKFFFILSSLAATAFGTRYSSRFDPQPGDYLRSGPHYQEIEKSISQDCIGPLKRLSSLRLQACAVELKELALRTYNQHNEFREAPLESLLLRFSKSNAPSDWDLSTPLLGIVLDRIRGTDQSGALVETINPGLWYSAASQLLSVTAQLQGRSRVLASKILPQLAEVTTGGTQFLERLSTPRTGGPDRNTFLAIYAELERRAKGAVEVIKSAYEKQRSQSGGMDFFLPLNGKTPKLSLGRSLSLSMIHRCKGVDIPMDPKDIPFPSLFASNYETQLRALITHFTPYEMLAAEDLVSNEHNFSICYEARGWETEREERKNGDDKGYFNYLVGRFFVVFKGTVHGETAFRIKVYGIDSIRHHIVHYETNNLGQTERKWVDRNWTAGNIDYRFLNHYENQVLDELWHTQFTQLSFAPETVRSLITKPEWQHQDKKRNEFLRDAIEAQRERINVLRSDVNSLLIEDRSLKLWSGASKLFRMYAMLIAPESFSGDANFRALITAKGSLQELVASDAVLEHLAKGNVDELLSLSVEIRRIVLERTAPELAPQKLKLVSDTVLALTRAQELIQRSIPSVPLLSALKNLRNDILKFTTSQSKLADPGK